MCVLIRLLLCCCLLALSALDAHADKRVALVIGNGAYRSVPALINPAHDAADVTAALKQSGFDVISGTDLDQIGMQDAVIRFAREARDADVAMFYYSGHALQYAGVNYLVPVDAILRDEVDLKRMARADDILADLQQAKNLRILVLDACRDNPFADTLRRSVSASRGVSIGRGLAKMESPEGTIISYATQAGRTADDGDGRNSPYTSSFLKHIHDKGNISAVFQAISAGVYAQTKGTQIPELSLSFFGEFYLNGKSENATAASPQSDPCADAAEHWRSADAIGTAAALEDHIRRFPTCAFADLARSRLAALSKPAEVTKPTLPFDGTWVVNEMCTSKPPFFPAATFHYALQVTDGRLHTTFGEGGGKPGSVTFDGKIAPDGSARISVNGYTDPARDPLHRAAGTPFHYALALEFKQSSGTGVRTETPRPCRMELSRPSASDPSRADAEIPAAKPFNEVPLPSQVNLGKESNPGERKVERHPGIGLSCSTMRARCAAVCVAKTGLRNCASTVCVRMEEVCLSTGCWKGRGFSGCGLAKR